jgi:hypothetical protein
MPTIVAEVVMSNATSKSLLVVFIDKKSASEVKFNKLVSLLAVELPKRLPTYMVPRAYIPMDFFPMTAGGKMDRKRLREMGSSLSHEQLIGAVASTTGKPLSTEAELLLQKLWESILKIPAKMICADTSFLHFGDSISAMRLASLARSQSLSLTVQNILSKPRLSEMAKTMTSLYAESTSQNTVLPFSLLRSPTDKDATLEYITRVCSIQMSEIEDVYPVTGVQKSLLSMTAKSDNSYIARFSLTLREDVDLTRLKKAWEDVSRNCAAILRSRILDVPAEGLVQVQLDENLGWDEYQSVSSYLECERAKRMGLGTPLTRLAIITSAGNGEVHCVLTQHHAIYDGYSVDLLVRAVSRAYAGVTDNSPVAPFQAFIKQVVNIDREETTSFWRQQFLSSEAVPFPVLPEPDYRPKADSTVRRQMVDLNWPKGDATANTIIRAAWAILTARYNDSDDVVFGAMVTGRQAPLTGIDRMIAPLINAVPIRVKLDPNQSVHELLLEVQKQSVSMIPFEQTELLDIRRINPDSERGSYFNTLLVVQPAGRGDYGDGPFTKQSDVLSAKDGLDDFNPNAVMIMCQLNETNGFNFEISFDSKVVDLLQMERIASQFEHVLRQLCALNTQLVGEVETISKEDLEELWTWNADIPSTVNRCVHDLISETVKRQLQAPAICSWDGNISYAELNSLSNTLALQLMAQGVQPGNMVPLCFEKSMWYPVAALAVMKAGGICVAMDATQPQARLRSIVQQVKPSHVLTSVKSEGLATSLSDANVIIADRAHVIEAEAGLTDLAKSLPKISPSETLYVVFTSGSTGTPKGVVTTHQNFASASTHQAEILHIKPGTRVFDFVSYNFDVSWSNTLQTLLCGGCLCIPSEWERKNDIPGSLNRMKCDYV